MAKSILSKSNSSGFVHIVFVSLYLFIGFIPNWAAVDKIAPQWLVMSTLNLISLLYFFYNRKILKTVLTINLKTSLNYTYFGFIIWAMCSVFYAINPTEVIVNVARQFNVMLMFISMSIFLYGLKNKIFFIPWIVTIILGIEIYAVLNEALSMVNSSGIINSGNLKGLTANRNITAFSIAIKLPFVLCLIHNHTKNWIKFIAFFIITLSLISLSMIESRAAFIAVGIITFAYVILNCILYLRVNREVSQLIQIGYFIIPLLIAISINQGFLSKYGADAVSRAATIKINTTDGSVNQRLRYYEDVLTHMSSNPIFGVGLGNWKLKSIEYDSKDITGYVVPYHAHSDFIQLGAELGIVGFLFYVGLFIWVIYFTYFLLFKTLISYKEKVFIFLLLVSLAVYLVDANLNFPIARPQVLIVFALIFGLISSYYQNYKNQTLKIKSSNNVNIIFLILSFLFVLPSVYINNSVYRSLKAQMFLLQDFNSNQYNFSLNKLENDLPIIPNITVTTIPINSIKARYYVNSKKYNKALKLIENGTKANPYLFYSEILKSQIYQEKGQLDSAKIYARKAFFGLPNNALHSSRYLNLIGLTRDKKALDEAFDLLTYSNNPDYWKNYLIIANSLTPPKDKILAERAKKASLLFPYNNDFKALYREISVGNKGIEEAASLSSKGLEYFNNSDYFNAAVQFELAIQSNPLDYAHFENAATSNYLIGNLEIALEQIEVVIKDMNPLDGKCEYIKALIFLQMGDPIGACPLLATSKDSGYAQASGMFDQYCR